MHGLDRRSEDDAALVGGDAGEQGVEAHAGHRRGLDRNLEDGVSDLVRQVAPGIRVLEAEDGRQADDLAILEEGADLVCQPRAVLLVVEAARVVGAGRVNLTLAHDVVDGQGARLDRGAVGAVLTRQVLGDEAGVEVLETGQSHDGVAGARLGDAGLHGGRDQAGGAQRTDAGGNAHVAGLVADEEIGADEVTQPRDGRADKVGGDVAVGVGRTGGHVAFQCLQGRLDRFGAVAEDVDRARSKLDATHALRDEGDAQSRVGCLDCCGQACQASADNDDVPHRTTSSLGAGRCSTSSVPS